MKLLVLDVEGTLFKTSVRLPGTQIDSTIWQAIANALGPDAIAAEVETHRRWHSREYHTYLDWVSDTISIHQRYGLKAKMFKELIMSAEYNENVHESLGSVDRSSYEPVLVSGGFRELAARAQVDLGIKHAFAACEYFFDDAELLRGYNLLPCDFEGKLDFIQLMLREYRLSDREWLFVGDGLNDVPIAKLAPFSVAYRGHPALREVATVCIDDFRELTAILANGKVV